ncbi:LPXTG cell wall anchor domain-containing protein [Geodermatophilus ruber]|uniref:LPXTG-motif cell wall anchor domain-containing protein n=1 Tax=Geodermatophilus ruber TaxID=504800 RepID=A0A1I4B2U7_9ACTN|nr:LPXTG cell wall anchor domain-containing protein [Geodermatophilus ruber]SFK62206.1 LPXTG-motif cell wall anchor domain-containing protein [Geodermatophilus ruber]
MDSSSGPVAPAPPSAVRRAWSSGPRWPGAAEVRADLNSSLLLAGVLTLAGLPAGLLWWALAPRAQFEITESSPVVVGHPSAELLVAGDGVFTLVLAGLGLLAGLGGWWLRRRRGVATLLALALGCLLAGVLAWQLGELLGPGPTRAELAEVGAVVTTGLSLGSVPALAVAPFLATLVYVVATLLASSEDLGRSDPAPAGPPAREGGPAGAEVREDAGRRG